MNSYPPGYATALAKYFWFAKSYQIEHWYPRGCESCELAREHKHPSHYNIVIDGEYELTSLDSNGGIIYQVPGESEWVTLLNNKKVTMKIGYSSFLVENAPHREYAPNFAHVLEVKQIDQDQVIDSNMLIEHDNDGYYAEKHGWLSADVFGADLPSEYCCMPFTFPLNDGRCKTTDDGKKEEGCQCWACSY